MAKGTKLKKSFYEGNGGKQSTISERLGKRF